MTRASGESGKIARTGALLCFVLASALLTAPHWSGAKSGENMTGKVQRIVTAAR